MTILGKSNLMMSNHAVGLEKHIFLCLYYYLLTGSLIYSSSTLNVLSNHIHWSNKALGWTNQLGEKNTFY